MRSYKKITLWENRRAVKDLKDYKDLVITYFNNIRRSPLADVVQNNKSIRARSRINQARTRISDIFIMAGVNPIILCTPPPAIGGATSRIDLVTNVFMMHQHHIEPQALIDMLEVAIGKYNDDYPKAKFRTFTPFFWVGLLLNFVASLPFMFLGKMGLDQVRIESSLIGRLLKGVFWLATFLAAVLSILHLLGFLEVVKRVIGLPTSTQ